MRTLLSSATVLLAFAGCGGPDGDTWLIRTSSEEISVAETGEIWDRLEPEARQRFISSGNAVGEFVTSLGRKTMIETELAGEGYLESTAVLGVRNAWLRSAVFSAYRDSLEASVRQAITQHDLENYRQLMGKVVWYTPAGLEPRGPERLPDLGWELAFALDTIDAGESVEVNGIGYTLDSLVISADSLIQITLADTAGVNAFARDALTERRTENTLDSLKGMLRLSLSIDSSMVDSLVLRSWDLPDSTLLAFWDGGTLTVRDLRGIAELTSMGTPVSTESAPWVLHNLANHARLQLIEQLFANDHPAVYDELVSESDSFALEYASDLLFNDMVLTRIEITEEMLLDAYNALDPPPLMPETRVFLSAVVPPDGINEAMEAGASGTLLESFDYPGYARFLAPGEEHRSVPVAASQLPADLGAALFSLPGDNREWQRPVEVEEDLFVMFRLDSVIPPHEAEYDEVRLSLMSDLFSQLREQETMNWMRMLEEEHSLEINSDILEKLPPDPGDWSEL